MLICLRRGAATNSLARDKLFLAARKESDGVNVFDTGAYTADGVAGLAKEGAVGREQVIAGLTKHLGGSLISAYWAAGGDDHFFVIVDVPNGDNLAALWMAVESTGAATVTSTRQVFSAEEIDQIRPNIPGYRAPGE